MNMKERYIKMDNKKNSTKKKQTTTKARVAKVKTRQTREKTKNKKKSIFTTENILAAVFGILLIVVIVLGVMVFNKSRENKDKVNANLVVPIFEVNAEENVSLNTLALANEDEYVLKITNYKDDKVIAEKVNYSITVENDSKAIVKVTKNKDTEDLMKNQKSTVIENQELKSNTKEDVYYHISITEKNKIDKDDKVNIKIAS